MTKKEKAAIIAWAATLTDTELKQEAINSVLDTLGSEAELMYDRGWDMRDVIEREMFECWLLEKADILVFLCDGRGIDLWH